MIFLPAEARRNLAWSLWQCDYNKARAQAPLVHLFARVVPVNLGTTRADMLAVESGWGGYSPLPLAGPSDQGITPGGNDLTLFRECLWTATTGGLPANVVGYWIDLTVYRGARGLAWIEYLPTPVLMYGTGDVIAITPQFAFGQLQPDALETAPLGGGLVYAGDLLP